ncbi:hypothetical protein L486_01504 [Kwoniella mangroviensis CBS 10435]|uniref:V-type ATPase assembly factor PKR1 n=1 Tax=Kwoniella mangroviensis CBS 10435 TaxID=1331196 RepID=A0A1B9J230_9TREE|nr:uncharacterized protein I203_03831 [Kwoniella mangroviensis CBS 8507]OCF61842.1 hypothetical protein L486_01504 [Kwoniella mangroviensis CBS 10435]OCF67145.1 hypothetical protein I203_03831 [Kwoniella mangroviensis CBS 8507]OCF77860.1 hypothetical protein I204_01862 [Kwoniella mangroviensis CBS 8886]
MVTKDQSDSSSGEGSPVRNPEAQNGNEQPGFFGMLIKSVFEPGANAAVVMAMNLCFFFLLLTLFGLAVLTQWNKHVLLLLGVTALLWGSMMWFVLELTKVQSRPDNMPPATLDLDLSGSPAPGQNEVEQEKKKDR